MGRWEPTEQELALALLGLHPYALEPVYIHGYGLYEFMFG